MQGEEKYGNILWHIQFIKDISDVLHLSSQLQPDDRFKTSEMLLINWICCKIFALRRYSEIYS